MRKAVIIIAIGLTLIITGGIVTAMELSTWTPYDLDQNVANFEKETISTQLTFEDLGSERLVVTNNRWIDFDYEDYLHGHEDFFEIDSDFDFSYHNAFSNSNDYSGVTVAMDEKQPVGTINIEYTYAKAFDNETCGLDSVTFGANDNRVDYRFHVGSRNHVPNTRIRQKNNDSQSRYGDDNTTYLFPQCYGYNSWGFGFNSQNSLIGFRITDELKAILKHKQVPVRMSEITVTINPKDSSRVESR